MYHSPMLPLPPRPENESARLLSLQRYCVLDTPPEPVFDHLTALAAALFQMPVVLISLVDEHRQFFKSAVGLTATESDRNSSFCTYTILSHTNLVVLDTLADERFCNNPLVLGPPHIRFYAGAPLIGREGLVLGSFCIISDLPRESFSATDGQQLARFAALTVEALEYRLFPGRIAETEKALLEANERYRLAARATTDGIWDWDLGSDLVYCSARMRAIMGAPEEEHVGDVEEWLRRLHPADAEAARLNIERLLSSPVPSFESESRLRHEDGSWRWVHNRGTAVRDTEGKLLRLIGAVTDITDRKARDQLTGLDSQASLLTALETELDSRRSTDTPFALLCLDFEQFQRVNSSLGHSCGDLFLNETAVRLRRLLNSGAGDMAARIVADEFAVLLHDVAHEEEAMVQALRLLAVVEGATTCEERTLKLTASMGLVLSGPAVQNAESMLRDAHAAMHEAKARGGSQVCLFSQSIRDRALERVSLESELREALNSDEVCLYYQPKVRMDTGELLGFEALMRWHHPKRGTIAPPVFIRLAEESDLILEIGRWTLREALRQLALWREGGLVGEQVTMAVNLSARQFSDTELITNLKRKLARFGLPASCLALEITEGILILDVARAQQILEQLQELGVGVDLDDFGTGYSSLSYLQRFPFDCLKVDRSFVRDLATSSDAQAIAQAIIGLGTTLNLAIIAEGVETEQQAELLQKMGCVLGQGYLFGHPLPAGEMAQQLSERTGWRPRDPSFDRKRSVSPPEAAERQNRQQA